MPTDIEKTSRVSLGTRSAALVVAMGALSVATPTAATPANHQTAVHHQGSTSANRKSETVEQHIRLLHAALEITPGQETDWSAVAQVMRENDVAMQKLVAKRKIEAPNGVSALDDLITYEKFNRAHVEGLKDLISSFGTLYKTMPDPQKALADRVFQRFHQHGLQSNS